MAKSSKRYGAVVSTIARNIDLATLDIKNSITINTTAGYSDVTITRATVTQKGAEKILDLILTRTQDFPSGQAADPILTLPAAHKPNTDCIFWGIATNNGDYPYWNGSSNTPCWCKIDGAGVLYCRPQATGKRCIQIHVPL